jgi:hypothetical protein
VSDDDGEDDDDDEDGSDHSGADDADDNDNDGGGEDDDDEDGSDHSGADDADDNDGGGEDDDDIDDDNDDENEGEEDDDDDDDDDNDNDDDKLYIPYVWLDTTLHYLLHRHPAMGNVSNRSAMHLYSIPLPGTSAVEEGSEASSATERIQRQQSGVQCHCSIGVQLRIPNMARNQHF